MFPTLQTSCKGTQPIAPHSKDRRIAVTVRAFHKSSARNSASDESSQHHQQDVAVQLPRRAALALPLLLSPLLQSWGPAIADTTEAGAPEPRGGKNPVPDVNAIDWKAVKEDIMAIIKDDSVPGSGIGEKGPTIVRLAWHASGTYDKMSKTGGSGSGTIRFKEELTHGANGGLDKPVKWLQAVKDKHPKLSYADLYTFAGVVAVEAMGGPKVEFRAGRVDAKEPTGITPDGRLPEPDKGNPMATAKGLRDVFGRMGFNDQEIVALSGAHALGRCHLANSGYEGPWQATPTIFGNIYYILLKKVKWSPDDRYPKLQYKDPAGTIMMLPSDIVLLEDPAFKEWVDVYAKSRKRFYADFAAAFQKLLELGTDGLIPIPI